VCEFCDEFSGGTSNSFFRLYAEDLSARTLLETPSFCVVPSLGQMVSGYLMIVPKDHIARFSELRSVQGELLSLTNQIKQLLTDVYCEPLLFEHGASGPNSGGCGIYHAHLHFVPIRNADLIMRQLQNDHEFRKLPSMSALFDVQADPYIYVEHSSIGCCITETKYLPSQYIRRIIAESLRLGEWDWRKCGRENSLMATMSTLGGILRTEARHDIANCSRAVSQ
jgi:diadenosine tetraphosphate (Ap4A) HIT family hydrolase